MKNISLILLFIIIFSFQKPVSAQEWIQLGGTNSLVTGGPLTAICSDPSGSIYVAGEFPHVLYGTQTYGISKFNGNIWSAVGTQDTLVVNGSINFICSDPAGNIYAAGSFTNDSGNYYVAKYNGTTWSELGGTNSLYPTYGLGALYSDAQGNIYTAGLHNTGVGNPSDSLPQLVAKWDGTTWSRLSGLNPAPYSSGINAICTDPQGNVYVAGNIANTMGLLYVAKWDGAVWSSLGGINGTTHNYTISCLVSDASGNLYAGGYFLNDSGNIYVAKWNGTSWSELGGLNSFASLCGYPIQGSISAMLFDASGNLCVTGGYRDLHQLYFVAKWDGTNWSELGGSGGGASDPGGANGNMSMCIDASNSIYLTGRFANYISPSYAYVTKYIGTQTCANIAVTVQVTSNSATASGSGGAAPYSYLWSNGATTASVSGLSIGTYHVSTTDHNGCTSTESITISSTQLAVAGTTTNVLCNGQSNGSITLSPAGGTSPYTFSWSNSATTQNLINLSAGTYTVTVTDAASHTVTGSYTVNQSAALLVSGNVQNTCNSTPTGVITTTASGGAPPYVYLWSNGCINAVNSPLSAGPYSETVVDTNGCQYTKAYVVDTSASVTPLVTIRADTSGAICSGALVTFTATPTNGGIAPYYQWKVNGNNVVGDSAVYATSSLQTNDSVWVVMASNAACPNPASATSTAIIIPSVIPSVTPSVSITGSDSICAGSLASFTATSTNGGSTPAYQWKANGADVGSNATTYSSLLLANGNVVSCVLNSNATCLTTSTATSNSINLAVTDTVTPVIYISPSIPITICAGDTVVTHTYAIGGGNAPTYQWQINGVDAGSDSSIFSTSALGHNDSITCVLTSNAACATVSTATSIARIVTVASHVMPFVTMGADSVVCNGELGEFFAYDALYPGSHPVYVWEINNNIVDSGAFYSSANLVNGDVVAVVMHSSESCASPDTAVSYDTVIVVPTVLPTIGITGNDTICRPGTDTFTAVITNGGPSPVFQWWVNNTAVTGSATYTLSNLVSGDVVKCVLTSNATCATPAHDTSNLIAMTVYAAPATPVINSNSPVCSNSALQLTTTAVNGAIYTWAGVPGFTSAQQNPVIDTPSVSYSGTYSLVLTVNGCSSAPGTTDVTVNASPAVPVITQNGYVLSSVASTGNQWLQNGAALSGANAQLYTVTTSGWYAVQVTGADACTSTSDSVYVSVTGVQQITLLQAVNVQPNPFSRQFELVISSAVNNLAQFSYTLTDALGRVIAKSNSLQYHNTIDMQQEASGVYFLQVVSGGEQVTFKVVKTE